MTRIGRFAPSPSGRMHLGNAFSYLLAWLDIRAAGGKLILRIEDLDRERCSAEKAELLRSDLRWLGLTWDEETQPQSLRDPAYLRALERLRSMGAVFPCWCSRGQLHAASAPHASDGHFLYPGTCRDLTPVQRAQRTGPHSLRLRVPDETVTFTDRLYGPQSQNLAAECGDFVIRRADGIFAYQLAVVVDDAEVGVTDVVRGRDLLSSTARQLYLFRLLDAAPPDYMHVPMLTAPDGRKLSKRDGDLDLGALRASMTPQALLGRLGAMAGITDRPEPISLWELLAEYDPSRLRREDIPITAWDPAQSREPTGYAREDRP